MASLVGPAALARFSRDKAAARLTAEAGVHSARRIRSPHLCSRIGCDVRMPSRRTACSMAAAFRRRFSTRRSSTSCCRCLRRGRRSPTADRDALSTLSAATRGSRSTVSATDARSARRPPGRGRAAQESLRIAIEPRSSSRSRGAGAQSDRERRQPASVVSSPAVAPAGSRAPARAK